MPVLPDAAMAADPPIRKLSGLRRRVRDGMEYLPPEARSALVRLVRAEIRALRALWACAPAQPRIAPDALPSLPCGDRMAAGDVLLWAGIGPWRPAKAVGCGCVPLAWTGAPSQPASSTLARELCCAIHRGRRAPPDPLRSPRPAARQSRDGALGRAVVSKAVCPASPNRMPTGHAGGSCAGSATWPAIADGARHRRAAAAELRGAAGAVPERPVTGAGAGRAGRGGAGGAAHAGARVAEEVAGRCANGRKFRSRGRPRRHPVRARCRLRASRLSRHGGEAAPLARHALRAAGL